MTAVDVRVLREALIDELVEWIETTFIPASHARRFHKRVRTLARQTGRTWTHVMGELNEDARRALDRQLAGR